MILGVGKPSALHVKLIFWFSRMATEDCVLSASMIFGGTEIKDQHDVKKMSICNCNTFGVAENHNLVWNTGVGQLSVGKISNARPILEYVNYICNRKRYSVEVTRLRTEYPSQKFSITLPNRRSIMIFAYMVNEIFTCEKLYLIFRRKYVVSKLKLNEESNFTL